MRKRYGQWLNLLKDILMAPATRPFTDYGFKKLFGGGGHPQEPNKNLLLAFLNELLKEEQIKHLK